VYLIIAVAVVQQLYSIPFLFKSARQWAPLEREREREQIMPPPIYIESAPQDKGEEEDRQFIKLPPNSLHSLSAQAQAAKECVSELIANANSSESGSNNNAFVVRKKTYKQQRRQILYLHPGPPKTATSTIQKLLSNYETQLNRDNIFYLGKSLPRERWKCKFPHLSFCLVYQQYRPGDEALCREIIVEQLNEYYRAGVDVILSDELFGETFKSDRGKEHLEVISNVIRGNNWEIRVLIGYRPYFEFVKSAYSQEFKARSKPKLLSWPGSGGIHIPPVKDWMFRPKFIFTERLLSLFEPYADGTNIFDITESDQQGDLSERLFCDWLEDAEEACSSIKASLNASDTTSIIVDNISYSHDYDRIATAAAAMELVNTTKFKRHIVTKWVREFMEEKNHTLHDQPLLCPTENESDKLYNASLEAEMKLFPGREPNWESPGRYDAMVKKQKLCSVDTKKLLEKDGWKEFFHGL
jgi:hypothetical protein